MHMIFWLENLKKIVHLEDLGIDRWMDNIKIDLGETVWKSGLDSIVGSCGQNDEPGYFINAGSFLIKWITINFWRNILCHEVSYITVPLYHFQQEYIKFWGGGKMCCLVYADCTEATTVILICLCILFCTQFS